MKFMYFLAMLLLAYSVNGKPDMEEDDYAENYADDDNNDTNNTDSNNDYEDVGTDADEEEVPPEPPIIETTPQHFIAKENQTIYLPCEARNADMYVTLWKKNDVLLAQSSFVFVNKSKAEVMKNRTLVIKNADANDTGKYTCQLPFSNKESVNITHRVFVESAPIIQFLKARDDVVELKAGETLALTCNATGFPKPEIKWYFQNAPMDASGETLTIENVVHDAGGDYRCLADNKVGRPAHDTIKISIIHKPKIQMEKLYVDTGILHEIRCVVHASPQATVNWKRDGVHLKPSATTLIKQKNNFHRLIFKKFDKNVFGNYTCSAKNDIGEVEDFVVLDKLSDKPYLLFKRKEHLIEWTMASYTPVLEAIVYYKTKTAHKWLQTEGTIDKDGEDKYKIGFNFNSLHHGNYEAKVKAKLGDGTWSQFSDTKEFTVMDDSMIDEADLRADVSNNSNIALKDQEGSIVPGPQMSGKGVLVILPTMTTLLMAAVSLLA